MKKTGRWVAAVAVTAVALGGGFPFAPAAGAGDDELPGVCQNRPRRPIEIDTAKLIIEFNATDDDVGVHGAFDDHGWSELCVFDPRGRPIAVFDPRGQLDDLTMAGVFFESREPPTSEFSMEDLTAAFPEGEYTVRGRSFDGKVLVGSAMFTHDVPAPPAITAPELAEDPEQPGAPVARRGLFIGWEPVTETVAGAPITITGYEVLITKKTTTTRTGSRARSTTSMCPPR